MHMPIFVFTTSKRSKPSIQHSSRGYASPALTVLYFYLIFRVYSLEVLSSSSPQTYSHSVPMPSKIFHIESYALCGNSKFITKSSSIKKKLIRRYYDACHYGDVSLWTSLVVKSRYQDSNNWAFRRFPQFTALRFLCIAFYLGGAILCRLLDLLKIAVQSGETQCAAVIFLLTASGGWTAAHKIRIWTPPVFSDPRVKEELKRLGSNKAIG